MRRSCVPSHGNCVSTSSGQTTSTAVWKKYWSSGSSSATTIRARSFIDGFLSRAVILIARERDEERAALPGPPLGADLAAVPLHDAAADGKPHAAAFEL